MDRARPLFIVGNKRSGSSLMVNLLNQHPHVFLTHESDVVWILYQIHQGLPLDRLRSHPMDEAKGLRSTLAACSEILTGLNGAPLNSKRIRVTFKQMLQHINWNGSRHERRPLRKDNLRWIGDKKPVQQADPTIRAFLHEHFPEARFIHLVRNPLFVAASMAKAARTWDAKSVPHYWRGTVDSVLSTWAQIEEWVLSLKASQPSSVHTVRLEDLSRTPVEVMSDLFVFLDLDPLSESDELFRNWVWKDPNQWHETEGITTTARVRRIMRRYRYGG